MLITTLSSEVRGQRCTRPYPWTVSHRESNFNSFRKVALHCHSRRVSRTAPVNHRPGSWVSEAQLSVGPLKLVSAKARAARLSARHDATAAAAPEAAGAER